MSVREALEAERKLEQEFVERARQSEKAPAGWPAALVMFHIGMWRERLRDALAQIADGVPQTTRPPAVGQVDEFNDTELAHGIGTPLGDAAARSEHLLSEILDLYTRVGEQPIEWNETKNTTVAVLRNSFTHPRIHLYAYYRENGLADEARRVYEDSVDDLRRIEAPPAVMGAALYNLAIARCHDDRGSEALDLLRQAVEMRPDLKAGAAGDSDLEALHEDPGFKELVSS